MTRYCPKLLGYPKEPAQPHLKCRACQAHLIEIGPSPSDTTTIPLWHLDPLQPLHYSLLFGISAPCGVNDNRIGDIFGISVTSSLCYAVGHSEASLEVLPSCHR
jgi:hypothetical protein